MTRFRRLAVVSTAATFVLIAVGALVRATDSGLGCPDWPRCFGRLVPPAELHAWIEHSHRLIAAVVVALVALLAVAAWRTGQARGVRWAAAAAVVVVLTQALIGAVVVWWKLEAESVTLHLGTALALVALLELIAFRARWPAAGRRPARDRGFVRLVAVGAGLTYLQMLVGSTVTGHDAGLAYPLNVLLPDLGPGVARIQLAHRALAAVVATLVVATWLVARRTQRAHPTVTRLAGYAAGLVLVQVALGAANVGNRLSALTVVPHLVVGSLLWGTMFALLLHADRFAGTLERDPAEPEPLPARGARESAAAYFLLTKPRIVELLLVTTVPTMFIAERGIPSPWLVAATLFGGALSAASANVINCYLDRDIDALMRRTARRPLPAHRVAPVDALRFGLVLGVAGFAWLWATVNLLSAVLATAAILFYVFVYTLGLKRRSTQNIVIGGAAGAVPVLVGWAAVTGRVELPALVLFAIIFYWTPPHFWALALRYKDDYAAAGVPMLPVVRGAAETSTQILYYTVLLVTVTLLLYPAGRMGAIYLASAVALGAAFIWRALALRRDLSSKRAIRLFSFSNQYLALLFLAMALD
ncbi:MAG TPA: heme o synthase, partial [Actinomycetota bacterium]|nr:heme o synthase [Actinomycetota bacterium]